MTITNGQKANQTNFNNAFVSKSSDSTMQGKLSLNNTSTGSEIENTQDVLLDTLDTLGFVEGATDQKTYANTNYIADGDNRKVCIEKLDAQADVQDGALTTHAADTSTHGVGVIVGTSEAQTITNKVIDADNNTISNLAHGSEVDNPTSGVHGATGTIVGNTDTITLTNKTFDDEVTAKEIATPSNPASGYQSIYPKPDGKWYTLDDAGVETEVGSGSGGGAGGINYIVNSDFEDGIANWNVSTGATLAIALDTSSKLRGVNSLEISKGSSNEQDYYVYSDTFTIDEADKLSMTTFSFDYDCSDAQYDTGDLVARVYDVTNAAYLSGIHDIPAGKGSMSVDFQTTSSAQYQVRFMVNFGVTTNWDLYFDNIIYGPQTAKVYGTPSTDWEDSTISGSFNNITYTGKEKRTGDSKSYEIHLLLTGTPTSGGFLSVTLPDTIDTSKLVAATAGVSGLGEVKFFDSSTGTNSIIGIATYLTSNTIKILLQDPDVSGTASNYIKVITSSSPLVMASGDRFTISLKDIPIAGLSSNVVMSESTSNRYISTLAYLSSDETVNSTSAHKVLIDGITDDTIGSFNSGSNRIDILEDSHYNLYASAQIVNAASSPLATMIYLNGSPIAQGVNTSDASSNLESPQISLPSYPLVKGDYIELYTRSFSDSSYTVIGASYATFLSVNKGNTGSQTIAQSEKQRLHYYATSGTIPTTEAALSTFTNKVVDTHGSWTSSTSTMAIARDGYLKGNISFNSSGTATTGYTFQAAAFLNGTEIARKAVYSSGSYIATTLSFSNIVVSSGDSVQIKFYGQESSTLNTSGTRNFISLTVED